MAELTEEQRKLIDELAGSVSRLCHTVIKRRLEQFFEVIGDEIQRIENEHSRTETTDHVRRPVRSRRKRD